MPTTTTPRSTATATGDPFPPAALLVMALTGFLLPATETMPAGRRSRDMTIQIPTYTLNNGGQMTAVGFGVFQAEPEQALARASSARRDERR